MKLLIRKMNPAKPKIVKKIIPFPVLFLAVIYFVAGAVLIFYTFKASSYEPPKYETGGLFHLFDGPIFDNAHPLFFYGENVFFPFCS